MNHVIILLLTLHFVFSQNRNREHSSSDYSNLQVNRTVDLSSNIITIETHILIKSMKVDPIYSYRLLLLKNNSQNLINIEAHFKSLHDEESMKLKLSKQYKSEKENFDFYEINFKSEPINFEEERILIIKEDYFESLDMLPKKITLKDDQYVVFKDTVNHVSFYPTVSTYTTIKLPNSQTDIMYIISNIANSQKNTLKKRKVPSNIQLKSNLTL
jgi:hypothetical protein